MNGQSFPLGALFPYLRAFRFSHRFQPGTHLRAWLFQILRNTFLTFYRVRERESPVAEDGVHLRALERGRVGETYIIGGNGERRNIDVVDAICDAMDRLGPRPKGARYCELISLVADRPGTGPGSGR